MRRLQYSPRLRQDGFTVIELLIATIVFTVVLMLVTTGVIHFSNEYYKATNASATQNTVRTVSEDITQSLQFGNTFASSQNTGVGMSALCIGTKKYWYRAGVPYEGELTSGAPGLYVTNWQSPTDPTCDNSAASFPTSGGVQMLQENMRITSFSITPPSPTYTVSLRVAYGDNDLLCSPNGAKNCASGFGPYNTPIAKYGNDISCRSTKGSQFCAVSNITAAVGKRVD